MSWVCEYCNNDNNDNLIFCFVCGVHRNGIAVSIQLTRIKLVSCLNNLGIPQLSNVFQEITTKRLLRLLHRCIDIKMNKQ